MGSTTSLGSWGCLPCSQALLDPEMLGLASAIPVLDTQPLFQETFCPGRQPVSKATPCQAPQRVRTTQHVPRAPVLEQPRSLRDRPGAPRLHQPRSWGCGQFRWPCWPSGGGFR